MKTTARERNMPSPEHECPDEYVPLPREVVTRILDHAQRHPDEEVCGLVSARDGRPLRVYPVPNVASRRTERFEMDPGAQIAALRCMRGRGEELFAIYHSHPHGPARPSAIDLAEAAYPEALYLIVSLDTRGVLDLRGFRIRDGQARELHLEL